MSIANFAILISKLKPRRIRNPRKNYPRALDTTRDEARGSGNLQVIVFKMNKSLIGTSSQAKIEGGAIDR